MLPQSRPRWHRFFNIYPYLAIIPLGLLWMAVEVRIATYALTVSRIYLVAMSIALSLAYLILIIPKNSSVSVDFSHSHVVYLQHHLA